VVVPLKELKGFKRVSLKPGEKKTVEFELKPEDISIWDIDMNFINEPGKITVMVGASSEDIKETGEFSVK
jgi:beta-glucosidase